MIRSFSFSPDECAGPEGSTYYKTNIIYEWHAKWHRHNIHCTKSYSFQTVFNCFISLLARAKEINDLVHMREMGNILTVRENRLDSPLTNRDQVLYRVFL